MGNWELQKKAASNVEDKDPKKFVEDDNCLLHDAISSTIKYYILGYADSSEAQCIWQSKDVLQDPLETVEDKISCSELS